MENSESVPWHCQVCGERSGHPLPHCFACDRHVCDECSFEADELSEKNDILWYEYLCVDCKKSAAPHIERLKKIKDDANESQKDAVTQWRYSRKGLIRRTPRDKDQENEDPCGEVKIRTEPLITINGTELTDAQVMTLRVALLNFSADLCAEKHPLGDDDHGKAMTAGYKLQINEILKILYSESFRDS